MNTQTLRLPQLDEEFPFFTCMVLEGRELMVSASAINLKKLPVMTFFRDFYYRLPTGEYCKCAAVTCKYPEWADRFFEDVHTYLG